MKVRIEAAEGEIEAKALELAKSLLQGLAAHDPRLAKAIEALEETMESPATQTPAMQELAALARAIYEEELLALADDIDRELGEL